jgi:hypothetical protein
MTEEIKYKVLHDQYSPPLATQSAGIGALAAALAKAQGAMTGAKRDSENPFFRSSYADLASVWDACRGPLSANGLSVIQTTEAEGDCVTVVTTLAHASGEWVRGRLAMTPVKADPQGVGSALTYARRYALAAIVGIAPEDDDGNAASRPDHPAAWRTPPAPTPRAATPEPTPATAPAPTPAPGTNSSACSSRTPVNYETAKTVLGEVKTKAGKSKAGPWTLWFSTSEHGDNYSTFDESAGALMEQFSQAGEPVVIGFIRKQTPRGETREVKSIQLAAPPDAATDTNPAPATEDPDHKRKDGDNLPF